MEPVGRSRWTRDAGTNLAFLSANACSRPDQARPGPGRDARAHGGLLQDRLPCCPLSGRPPRHGDHRYPAASAPDPESSLISIAYEGHPYDRVAPGDVTRTTENLLRAFAAGPSGRSEPRPKDNVRSGYRSSVPA